MVGGRGYAKESVNLWVIAAFTPETAIKLTICQMI